MSESELTRLQGIAAADESPDGTPTKSQQFTTDGGYDEESDSGPISDVSDSDDPTPSHSETAPSQSETTSSQSDSFRPAESDRSPTDSEPSTTSLTSGIPVIAGPAPPRRDPYEPNGSKSLFRCRVSSASFVTEAETEGWLAVRLCRPHENTPIRLLVTIAGIELRTKLSANLARKTGEALLDAVEEVDRERADE